MNYKNKIYMLFYLSGFLIPLTLIYSISVYAEPTNVDEIEKIDEIIVYARKREEPLYKTPLSVTVFSKEDLDVRGLSDISQIGAFTPNMMFDSAVALSGSSNAASIYIRGIGQSDFVQTSEPGVGLYLDGVYIPRSVGGVLDLLDFKRVEVLKGPQGTLFGKNTIGGAINIITAKPDEFYNGKAELTYGELDRKEFRGTVNIPISNTLFSRYSFATKSRDGYVDRVLIGDTLGGQERIAGRASFRWLTVSNLEANFSFDVSDANDESPASTIISDDPAALGTLTSVAGQAYNALIPVNGGASALFPFLPALPAGTVPWDSRFLTNDL